MHCVGKVQIYLMLNRTVYSTLEDFDGAVLLTEIISFFVQSRLLKRRVFF
jgi:hypothetical protein